MMNRSSNSESDLSCYIDSEHSYSLPDDYFLTSRQQLFS